MSSQPLQWTSSKGKDPGDPGHSKQLGSHSPDRPAGSPGLKATPRLAERLALAEGPASFFLLKVHALLLAPLCGLEPQHHAASQGYSQGGPVTLWQSSARI